MQSHKSNSPQQQVLQEIYVNSTEPFLTKKRKKYTIFNYKRRSDGSLEKKKSVIYKDYHPENLKARQKKANQAMQYYVGSAAAIKKVL